MSKKPLIIIHSLYLLQPSLIHYSFLALIVHEPLKPHGYFATGIYTADIYFLLEVHFKLTSLTKGAFATYWPALESIQTNMFRKLDKSDSFLNMPLQTHVRLSLSTRSMVPFRDLMEKRRKFSSAKVGDLEESAHESVLPKNASRQTLEPSGTSSLDAMKSAFSGAVTGFSNSR